MQLSRLNFPFFNSPLTAPGSTHTIEVLCVGPFVLESVLTLRATEWQRKLDRQFGVPVHLTVANPPFQTDEIDCRGYWLNPVGRTAEQRIKQLKSHVSKALIELLEAVQQSRPHVIVGEGQGGVVVAMSTFPIILERACRDRAVTQHQMYTFRQAW